MVSFSSVNRESVLKAIKEYDRIGEDAFLNKYNFKPSKKYFLIHKRKRYTSKAIVSAAYGYANPKEKPAGGFSGGKPVQRLLQNKLKFDFLVLGEAAAKKTKAKPDIVGKAGEDWAKAENTAIVGAYFEMLAKELSDEPFTKSNYNEKVRQTATERSRGSVERKFQNVSAVLHELELPFIDGYKPLGNKQTPLVEAVEQWLAINGDQLFENFQPPSAEMPSTQDVFVDPPTPKKKGKARSSTPIITNWERKEAQSRRIGLRGEEFVVALERQRLIDDGRADLAKAVEWVAKTQGDGLGYDVLSYDNSGAKIYIEVKATLAGKSQPFFVTHNEIEKSKLHSKIYRLYRVFNLSKKPRIYVLKGRLDQACQLRPVSYQASPKL